MSLRTAVAGGTGYAVLCAEELMGYGVYIESEDPLLGRTADCRLRCTPTAVVCARETSSTPLALMPPPPDVG